ncbi:MAG: UDP-glucose 4-epimerase GalE [Flavobacteriales bacterium]|nr:MAG: UDP-glucose 4-epimerase GalE [Flavobacteriales bacterium]
MKILITGGAGYIGSHTIIEIIQNTDWEVVSIDNYSNSSEGTYDRIKEITGKEVQYYNIDLRDLSKTAKVFEDNPDIKGIIHFAAFKAVGESVEKPLMYYDNNINSLNNILKCQAKFNVPSLIFSSSCSVYGNVEELPVTENSKLSKSESPYAYTKQIGEVMVNDFINVNKGLKAISLRYFNPVGAHVTGLNGELSNAAPNNLVPFITQTAIGKLKQLTVFGDDYETRDGTCIRDYVHVSDIANAHVLALGVLIDGNAKKEHDIINLGTGNGVTVLEAINAFEKVSGEQLNYHIGARREGDVESIYANNEKAKNILNWTSEKNLDDMMLSAWKWEKYLKKNNF